MRKILIFGNSGSGKSTLARRLGATEGLAHFDLDTIAWLDTTPPTRAPLAESREHLEKFCAKHQGWVIEGCYADLLEMVLPLADEVFFLDLPAALCQDNARNRPWEPHKYPSPEAQDRNLDMLLQWIADYEVRTDEFSRAAHRALFDGFEGEKNLLTENPPPQGQR